MFMLERMHVVNDCAVWGLTVHRWLETVGSGPGPGHSMFASWDPLDEQT